MKSSSRAPTQLLARARVEPAGRVVDEHEAALGVEHARRRPSSRRESPGGRSAPAAFRVSPALKRVLRSGYAAGLAAYLLWGLFPLYWPLLEPAGAVEILAHRIVWSMVLVALLLALTQGFRWVRDLRPPPHAAARPGRRADHAQLGRLHLRRQQRARRRDLARLLHQPAGHGALAVRARRKLRRPQWVAVGSGRRGRRADGRLRPAAVDRAAARVLVRLLRAGQEAVRCRPAHSLALEPTCCPCPRRRQPGPAGDRKRRRSRPRAPATRPCWSAAAW